MLNLIDEVLQLAGSFKHEQCGRILGFITALVSGD